MPPSSIVTGIVRRLVVAAAVGAGCSPSPNTALPATFDGELRSAPIIDSHVHLAYWDVADELAASGVLGAVDLGAPEDRIPQHPHVIAAGPLLTSPGGYPLESWGRDGYGIGCADAICVRATIERLATRRGVKLVKIAADDNGLDPVLLPIVVAAAHDKQLKVAAHAMTDASARRAGEAGVDVLAHTPVAPLSDATIALWRGRAVISTLSAFGGTSDAVANLAKLRAGGAMVLYGTDLGNLRDAGPSADEVALLARAGMDDASIVAAMTTVPATYWGIDFGETSYLVVSGSSTSALLHPVHVVLDGKELR